MDIVGCPECPVGIVADVRNLSRFKSREFGAVFVGHVLETIDGNMEAAVRELYRVADELFIAHIPPEALSARLHPEVKNVIFTAPPRTAFVEYLELSSGKRFRVNVHETA